MVLKIKVQNSISGTFLWEKGHLNDIFLTLIWAGNHSGINGEPWTFVGSYLYNGNIYATSNTVLQHDFAHVMSGNCLNEKDKSSACL